MLNRHSYLVIAFMALLFFGPAYSAQAYYSLGEPTGFVTDKAGLFEPIEIVGMNKVLDKLKRETGVEFAVVAIPSLEGDTVNNFAEKLFREWGIGDEKKDNGLLLLLVCCKERREARLEVGYGLEGVIPDAYALDIVKDIFSMTKSTVAYGDMSAQVVRKIMRVRDLIYTEITPVPNDNTVRYVLSYGFRDYFKWLIIFVLFNLASAFIVTRLRLGVKWWFGGIIGAIFGYYILGFWGGLIIGLIGLITDLLVSRKFGLRGGGLDAPIGGIAVQPGPGGFGGFGGGASGGGGALAK